MFCLHMYMAMQKFVCTCIWIYKGLFVHVYGYTNVCLYMYMDTQMFCLYMYIHVQTKHLCINIKVCLYMYMDKQMFVCTCTWIYKSLFLHVYGYTNVLFVHVYGYTTVLFVHVYRYTNVLFAHVYGYAKVCLYMYMDI